MTKENTNFLNDHDFHREELCGSFYALRKGKIAPRNWTRGEKDKKNAFIQFRREGFCRNECIFAERLYTFQEIVAESNNFFSNIFLEVYICSAKPSLRNYVKAFFCPFPRCQIPQSNFPIPQSAWIFVEPLSTEVMVI